MRPRLKLEVGLITTARFIFHTTHRMMYPFLAALASGMGVDLRAISLAITAFNTSGAFGPFLAAIADSRGRKAGILLGMGIFVVGLLTVAIHPAYQTFFIAAVLAGIGVAVMVPSTHAYLGDQVPYERRGLAISVTELSWSAAFVVGVPLVGLLISHQGWAAPFPILAGAGVVMMMLFAWLLPSDRPAPGSRGLFSNFKSVLTYGPALAGVLMGVTATAGNETINLVFGIWMGNSFGLQITALGAASMVLGLSELSGEGLAAVLVDRLGKQRSIALGFLVNCISAGVFLFLGRTLVGALFSLFFFYLSFEFVILSSLPLMTEIYPSARGTLMALNAAGLSLGRALGALAAAPLYQGWGIVANGLFAIVLDLLGLLLLRWVVVRKKAVVLETAEPG
ncbi:MAG TPA: MFS transporter [Anaerolineaceae bacterium]|jgi:predicted MFS family arabinose efflux permease